jgi:hypothetical protein
MGTSKLINSSTAFLFEVPEPDLPLVVQELQIGGASPICSLGGMISPDGGVTSYRGVLRQKSGGSQQSPSLDFGLRTTWVLHFGASYE